MKLKNLILLNERGMGMGYGSLSSDDTKLRPYPGSMDDVTEDWNGVTEGNGWFCYRESNCWDTKRSGASIYITEGEPHKFWIKVKTHGLRKPTDTNESYRQRVRKHTDKVAKSWITAARDLHNNPEINEVGNTMEITWKEAFSKALKSPKVSPFIAEFGEGKSKQPAAISDPVNFTPRLEENQTMNPKISYSAIVLDQQSHNKLIAAFKQQIPEGWKIYAHHMTMKLGELPQDKKSEVGSDAKIIATDLGMSDKSIAVKVSDGWTTNKIPHVTLAVNVKSGGKPVDSNNITNWTKLPTPIVLTGMIQEIPA